MATELAMAMRRLKAQETLAKEVADLNRKMDLVMAHLGIVVEVPAIEPNAEEVPASVVEVPAVETKSKKK